MVFRPIISLSWNPSKISCWKKKGWNYALAPPYSGSSGLEMYPDGVMHPIIKI